MKVDLSKKETENYTVAKCRLLHRCTVTRVGADTRGKTVIMTGRSEVKPQT